MASQEKEYLFNPARNPLFREDYRPTEYKIPAAKLYINLGEENTTVTSRLQVIRNPDLPDVGGPLELDGEDLKLRALRIVENGVARDIDRQDYSIDEKKLTLKRPPAGPFELEIVTDINPKTNTKLEGIYMAGDVLCSQCEANGFRHVTYFLDRPDNLAKFDVTLEGDKAKFPILLSNGNGDYRQTTDLGNGRHAINWVDPFPKPSYLFAAVGGDLAVLEDAFVTMSGRKIALRIAVEKGYEAEVPWAMQSVKRAMAWDEKAYGREYDLDVFHIVAVSKFNFGAMENKGLNIFNISALAGNADTSTDNDLIRKEAIIAHEYFHNWTGDRVTCRDWFQLTLKEGLTVLRDRTFTEDTHSRAIKKIEDATALRAVQFMEDAGSSAHPIRPDRVEEFNNIYSRTIYDKGSHVLGMLKTIVGDDTWRAGMDEYFNRFDGKAVTCEDFVRTHEEVSGADLAQFRRWYGQSGTPEVSYEGKYDANAKTYTLTLKQRTPATFDQPEGEKQPLHIPVAVGLIGESGKDIAPTTLLHLTEAEQTFVFKDVPGPVVPSLFRGFSAPVKITTQPTDDELIFRMAHDSDPFNKYDAAERLMVRTIHGLVADVQAGRPLEVKKDFLDAYAHNVALATDGDKAFAERVLALPPYNIVIQDMKTVDPDAVEAATDFLRKTLAAGSRAAFAQIYQDTSAPAGETYDVVPGQVGRRALHNLSLSRLASLETPEATVLAAQQYAAATNMTERYGALSTLAQTDTPAAEKALGDFYARYKDNANVLDKWLSLTASIPHGDALGRVGALMKHEAYDKTNPNKVRAVVGGFISNRKAFHAKDGSGYKFLADVVVDMNGINPQTAARLVVPLTEFKRYDAGRQDLMLKEMQRIMDTPNLGRQIRELVGKALDSAKPGQPSGAAQTFAQAAQPS